MRETHFFKNNLREDCTEEERLQFYKRIERFLDNPLIPDALKSMICRELDLEETAVSKIDNTVN
ncbi:MAG: hypothetical protein H6619_00110 [Deltaproteobacteria bacterium]|nr:hypothetical protein [Deltaproteobacteria bacterium]